jgi:hypothetical protein
VWDATVFSKNRDRLLDGAIAAKFLAAVLAQPRVKGLISSEQGEIKDAIDLDIEGKGNVVAQEFETLDVKQMGDLLARPGIKIIDAKDFVALREKSFAKMRADESHASGHQGSFAAGIGHPIERDGVPPIFGRDAALKDAATASFTSVTLCGQASTLALAR